MLDFPVIVCRGGEKIFKKNKTRNNNELKKQNKTTNSRFVRKEKTVLGAERVELDRIKYLSWSVDRAADSLLKID